MPDVLIPLPLALLDSVLNTVVVVAGIGLLIFVHEAGHFLVAKWHKVRVEAFSLGFGPVLWGFRRGDTHYRISLIPLGGYVKMAGENPTDEKSNDPAELQNKSVGARATIFVAGVVMNAIVAFLLFVVAFNIGVPLPKPVVGGVDPGSPAWKAGIRPGDRVETINGTRILDFQDIMEEVAFSDGPVDITVRRGDRTLAFEGLSPTRNQSLGLQQLGLRWQAERVIDVREPSPAWEAGLRPGDEVLSAAGEDWTDSLAVQTAVARIGEAVPFVVRRNGDTLTFDVHPAAVPNPEADPILGIQPAWDQVQAVLDGSPAAAAGLREQDIFVAVDGIPAPTVRAARAAARAAAPAAVTFTVRRDGVEAQVGPVAAVTTTEGWDAWFKDVVEGQSSTDTNRVTLMEDFWFEDGNPAARAGLPEGARILKVNGTLTPDFSAIRDAIQDAAADLPVEITWAPPGSEEPAAPVSIVRRPTLERDIGIPVAPATEDVRLSGIGASAKAGLRRSLLTGRRILQMLGGLFSGRVSMKNLGGPVAIFQISYTAAKRNFIHFLYFLGILSVNLAILNILPIPVLDGGHLMFVAIEAVRRRPLSERAMAAFQWAGLVLLMLLMAFVIVQDVGRVLG